MSNDELGAGRPQLDPTAAAAFESLKQVNPYGEEYWSARDLMSALGYDSWRRFADAIDRAMVACTNAGQQTEDHFVTSVKMILLGKGAQREVEDFFLSRFGCYLVAMNGDPRKAEIAAAQTYFVAQTRRAEQFGVWGGAWEALREAEQERLRLRMRLSESNKRLNAAAQEVGVTSRSFGKLHEAGIEGLYDLTLPALKDRKGVDPDENLADRMGRAELIANDFVRSQTEQKLRNEGIQGAEAAIEAHYEVGRETRGVIARTGGTLPEDLPAEPSIRPLLDAEERRRKRQERLAPPPDAPTLFDGPMTGEPTVEPTVEPTTEPGNATTTEPLTEPPQTAEDR